MSNTATGFAAIDLLASYNLADKADHITEHNTGIDVDGPHPGSSYDTESWVTFADVMWSVLNYVGNLSRPLPSGYTVDDLFSITYATERTGCTDVKVLSFSINHGIYDPESHGTHFEFVYDECERAGCNEKRYELKLCVDHFYQAHPEVLAYEHSMEAREDFYR